VAFDLNEIFFTKKIEYIFGLYIKMDMDIKKIPYKKTRDII